MAKVNKKRQMTKGMAKGTGPIASDKALNWFRRILLAAIAVLIFYPPFLRGLYFETEQLPAMIYTLVIFGAFWVYKFLKRDKRFLETPLDYAAFAFLLVYFISLFAAVSARNATAEWLKYVMFFAVFFMISDLVKTPASKAVILGAVTASAVCVSILGLDGAAGSGIGTALNGAFKSLGAKSDVFFGLFVGGRINSTLQYPNALASYLMAVYFVSLGAVCAAQRLWVRLLAGAGGFILIITFMLTMSRGAYIFLPIAAVLFIALLPSGSRVRGVAYAIPSVAGIGATFSKLSGYMAETAALGEGAGSSVISSQFWGQTALGTAITLIGIFLVGLIIKWLEKLNWKVYAVISAVLVAALGAGTFAAFNMKLPLELTSVNETQDSVKRVRRAVALEPDKEYKLVFEVEAENKENKPYPYSIVIGSRNFQGTIEEWDVTVSSFEGEASEGTEQKEISFKVPADSRTVSFDFINRYGETGAVFHRAQVVPVNHDGKAYEIALKYKFIPETLYSRFDLAKETRSGIERIIFYKDGMEIIKDHWLIGAGGGAWKLLYFSYQSYLYWTTQPHNYLVQIGIECGILGLLVLLFLAASLLSTAARHLAYRRLIKREDMILQSGIFAAIAAMLMHSMMDFDLSLSAVFLVLWELTGVYNATIRNRDFEVENMEGAKVGESMEGAGGKYGKVLKTLDFQGRLKSLRIFPVIGIVFTLLTILLPVSFLSGIKNAGMAASSLNSGNAAQAINYMKKAAQSDSLMPNYKIDFANLVIRDGRDKADRRNLELADKYAAQVDKDARYNVDIAVKSGIYYLGSGDVDKGIGHVNRAVELRPLRPEEWNQKADALMQVALFYAQKGQTEKAEEFFGKIMEIPDEVKEVNKSNMIPFTLKTPAMEIIERVKFIKDNEGRQEAFDLSNLIFYSVNEIDVNSDNIPDQWQETNFKDVALSMEEGKVIAQSPEGKPGFMVSRGLGLEAGKSYEIEVELEDVQGVTGIPFEVAGGSGLKGNLVPEGSVFKAEITTPEGLGNDNVLMLGVKGRYEIKNVSVIEK